MPSRWRRLRGSWSLCQNLCGTCKGGGLCFIYWRKMKPLRESPPRFIEDIKDLVQDVAGGLEEHLDSLPECIETWFKKRPRYTEEYWNEVPMPKKDANESLQLFIYKSFESVLILLQELLGVLLPHLSRFEENSSLKDEELIAFTRFRAFVGTLEDLVSALQISLSGGEKHAHSLRFHQKRGFLVSSAPIDVGQVVHDQLLETSSSVIFTSATLGNTGGDFGSKGVEWATGYSYLNPEKRFRGGLFLPPSYDYEKKMRVFLCDDVPPLFMDSFVPETLGQVTDLIEELGGRTLLLYGARKRFEVAREILLKKFEGKIPVFVQGMGSNVVENFKSSPPRGDFIGDGVFWRRHRCSWREVAILVCR